MTTLTSPAAPAPAAAPSRVAGGLLDPKMLLTSLPTRRASSTRGSWAQPGDVRGRGRRGVLHRVRDRQPGVFAWSVVVWLWLTVVFANLAEAVAEGRGKAQAATLRRAKTETNGPPPLGGRWRHRGRTRHRSWASATGSWSTQVRSSRATATSSTESPASTSRRSPGESAPVIRESGGDRSSVTGGTKVLSDRIVVEITARPGESFIDRMIALVEGASVGRRRRTRSP